MNNRSAAIEDYFSVFRFDQPGDWEDLKMSFSNDLEYGKHLFRGQCDSEWGLQTGLDRLEVTNKADAETYIINEFQRRYHHYLPESHFPASTFECIALMQHHGAPTRLLDWTFSPYVAAFFAVAGVKPGGSCALWQIDLKWCADVAAARINNEFGVPTTQWDWQDDSAFRKRFLSNRAAFVAPLQPDRMNERLTVQKGTFLCPGSVKVSFEDNLRAMAGHIGSGALVSKVIISHSQRVEILTDFQRMNVGEDTLFPGLDGFARSLGHSVCCSSFAELLESQKASQIAIEPPQK